jgi:hypothetical protein
VGPSEPRAGADIISKILPRLRCPGVQGSGFGRRSHFRCENSPGQGVSGHVRMYRAPAPPKEGGGAGVRHIRSWPAGRPGRDSQNAPTAESSRQSKASRPRQPGQADRHLEFGEHDFAGRKSTRRRCRRSGQKPARGQRRRLDFCPSLGVAVLSSPPEKSYPANSKWPKGKSGRVGWGCQWRCFASVAPGANRTVASGPTVR